MSVCISRKELHSVESGTKAGELTETKTSKLRCGKKLTKRIRCQGSHTKKKLPTSTNHNRIYLIIMLTFAEFYIYAIATILFVQYFSLLHKYNDNIATHSLLAVFL